jgi:formate C-acetyltransferase
MKMSYFGELTERMKEFREELLNAKPMVCAERAKLTTESYKEHADKPMVLRRAYMLENILNNMNIFIEPQTIIAGNQACTNRSAPIFPEYAMDWIIKELDEFELRNGDRFLISEDNKNTLRQIYPYWKGRTLQDKSYAAYPEKARLIYDLGIIRNEGNITSGDVP